MAGISLGRQVGFAALLFFVALALAEGAMRAVFWLRDDLPPTPDASLVYEWKWAEARLERGSAREGEANALSFDADLGWRPTPGFEGEGQRINGQALRADRDFVPGRRPGARRVALLGDSFTFGDHVANDETYAYFLETRELQGWEVLNFAVNGYGTDQALLAYELHGEDFAPDVVVMGFYVRDYERNTQRFKIYAKPVFEPVGDGLVLTRHPVPAPEVLFGEYLRDERRIGEVDRPYLWLSLQKALRRVRERSPSASDPEWTVLARLMRRFRDRVAQQGAEPVWLVLPYRDVVSTDRSGQASIEELCEREAAALELPLLRVDAAFREHARLAPDVALYRPRDRGGHFSVDGHRLVARTLATFLRRRGLLAPDSDS